MLIPCLQCVVHRYGSVSSSLISPELQGAILCSRCCADVDPQHRVRLGAGCRSCSLYFSMSQWKLKGRGGGLCNTSLTGSTAKSTAAIPARSLRLGLLLGVPTGRWYGVLVSYGSTLTFNLRVVDRLTCQRLRPLH